MSQTFAAMTLLALASCHQRVWGNYRHGFESRTHCGVARNKHYLGRSHRIQQAASNLPKRRKHCRCLVQDAVPKSFRVMLGHNFDGLPSGCGTGRSPKREILERDKDNVFFDPVGSDADGHTTVDYLWVEHRSAGVGSIGIVPIGHVA